MLTFCSHYITRGLERSSIRLRPFESSCRRSVGPEEKEDKEDEEGDGVLPLRGDLPDPEVLGKGDEKAAEGCAREAPHPTDNYGNNAHHKGVHAHRRGHVDIEGDEESGDAGKEGAEEEGKENRPVGVYAGYELPADEVAKFGGEVDDGGPRAMRV